MICKHCGTAKTAEIHDSKGKARSRHPHYARKDCPFLQPKFLQSENQPEHLMRCIYPICHDPTGHLIGACPALKIKCEQCGARGHHEDSCGEYSEEDYKAMYDHYRQWHAIVRQPKDTEGEKIESPYVVAFDFKPTAAIPKIQDLMIVQG